MINTVFYFPSSIDEYNAATVDPKTICFVPNANGNGSIYKGGKKFGGADISDVITAIQQYMELHPAHDYSADIESLQNNVVAMSATLRALSSISPEGIKNTFLRGFDTYKKMILAFEATGDTTWQEYTLGREDLNEWASEMGIISPQGNGYYQVGWSRLSQNVNEIRATVTQIGHTVRNLADNPASGEVDIEQLSADLYAYIHENAADAGISSTWGKYVARDEEDIQLLESMASTVQTYADNNVTFAQLLSAADDYRTGNGALANIYTKTEVDGAITTATAGIVTTNNLGTTVASIIAAINANLESNVTISADKIDLDGYTFVDNITAEYYDTDTVKVYDTTNHILTDTDWINPESNSTEEYTKRYTKTVLDVDGVGVKTTYNNCYANGANGTPIDHYKSYQSLMTSDSLDFHNLVGGEGVVTNVHINANTENGAVGMIMSDNHTNPNESPKLVSISPTLISVTGDINATGVVRTHTISHSVGIDDDATKNLTLRCEIVGLNSNSTSSVVLSGDGTDSTITANADYVNITTGEDVNINSTGYTTISGDKITISSQDITIDGGNGHINFIGPTTLGSYTDILGDFDVKKDLIIGNNTYGVNVGTNTSGNNIFIYAKVANSQLVQKYKLDVQKLVDDGYLTPVA